MCKEIKSIEEAFKEYYSEVSKNISLSIELKEESEGDELIDLSKFVKLHEENIKTKEESIELMRALILIIVDKISEYRDRIRCSREIIEETKEKIIDIID